MKDYAKKPIATQKRHQPHSGTNNLLLLLAILFVSFAGLHFIQKHLVPKLKPIPESSTITPIKKIAVIPKTHTIQHKKPDKKIKVDSAPVTINDQPKFDFYQLLPKMTVNISSGDTVNIPPDSKVSPKKSAPVYVLQIASLQKNADALQIQNVLKAAGYRALTQSYQTPDHLTGYRVLVGPFHHLKTAQAVQDKLDAHQTEALLTMMNKDL